MMHGKKERESCKTRKEAFIGIHQRELRCNKDKEPCNTNGKPFKNEKNILVSCSAERELPYDIDKEPCNTNRKLFNNGKFSYVTERKSW